MQGLGVIAALVTVQFLEVGLNTMVKAAMSRGMSNYIFVVYSNALAIFVLLLASIIYYRKRSLPPLKFSIVFRIFVLGSLSCSVQTFMYTGIGYSSPTLASAVIDLMPAFTFILAIISRMEKLDLRFQSSLAKCIGTIVSIAGALVVTLYKGLPITSASSPDSRQPNEVLLSPKSNWVIGGCLLATGSFCLAVLFIFQTLIIRDYPSELMVTLICSIFVTIQSASIALFAEKDPAAWRLRLDTELITICYSALFVIATRSVIVAWACRKKGPVYVALFSPLGMVIAVVMGVSFLGDTLYLGSVIGAVVIALGFYAVIWGQAQEDKTIENRGICSLESSSPNVPLLQNKNLDF
ncbi:WAT1-related protein At3g28050-like [Juglans microcarpa x Juglans regia]|uniref:WAT1-related protein At3g28050-like n=1 Tax=Juglans microcarpa x Juglans regia TaxID=2249226 RepID=UPI001B7EA1A3|nr:WAT1-related protein At3g28050-like [Juglans microcarpa x Juglans regia]